MSYTLHDPNDEFDEAWFAEIFNDRSELDEELDFNLDEEE